MQIKTKHPANDGGEKMASSPEPKGTLTPPGSSPLGTDCGSMPVIPTVMSPEAPPTPDSAYMTESANQTQMPQMMGGDERPSSPLIGARKRKSTKVHKIESDCLTVEESVQSLECPVCQEHLKNQHEFTQHIKKHNRIIEIPDSAKQYQCGLCKKTLSSNSSLDRHMLVHSGERPFTCNICGTHFTTNGNMHRHIRGHNRNSGAGGSDTGESDVDSRDGSSFLRKRHADSDDEGPSSKRARLEESDCDEVSCPVCGVDQDNSGALEEHLREEHPEYQRESTPKNPTSSYSLSETLFSSPYPFLMRPQSTAPEEIRPPVLRQCPHCPKTFESLETWIVHASEHVELSKNSFSDVRFENSPLLHANHVTNAQHEIENQAKLYNPFSKLSPKSLYEGSPLQMLSTPSRTRFAPDKPSSVSNFPQPPFSPPSGNLSHEEQFIRSYRDMKNNGQYPCRICRSSFANLRKLKSHNVEHMTTPPYRCNLCSFISNDKNTLKEHMKNHKGDTPYECNICSLAFTTKANCERHIKNIHGKNGRDEVKKCMTHIPLDEKQVLSDKTIDTTCHICSIDCKSKSVLRDHIRSSHPDSVDKPFSCKLCQESWHSYNDAFRHVIHAHPETNTGNMEGLVERRHVREESTDLSPVESLLSMSKFPIPLTPNIKLFSQEPRPPPPAPPVSKMLAPSSLNLSIKPISSFPNNISLLPPVFPGLPSSGVSQMPVSEAPLDLSMNNKRKNSESDEEIIVTDEEKPSVLNETTESIHKEEKTFQVNRDVEDSSKPPIHLSYPGHLPNLYSLPHPFYLGESLNPFRNLHPISQFDPSMLEGIQRNAGLGNDFNFLSTVNRLMGANQSGLQLSALALVASQNEKMKLNSISPVSSQGESAKMTTSIDQTKEDGSNSLSIKNTVLVKKPKQKRYRTERPWKCNTCGKGFTLRSNMERHIKNQHPDEWQTKLKPNLSPGLRAFEDQAKTSEAEVYSPELRPETEVTSDTIIHSEHSKEDEDPDLVIADESDEEGRESDVSREEGADLASVQKLLSTASSQRFPFFPKDCEELSLPESKAPGSIDEQIDEAKRSAYSSAPQKQKCPFCDRKFPWSSSLARHVRTHTGQKPYTCPDCGFSFTTKSNCDRHLQRKHPHLLHALGGDRPFKCVKCPGSTFSSAESQRKHEMFKHEKAEEAQSVAMYRCYVCHVPFATSQEVFSHIKNEHPDSFKDLQIQEPIETDSNDEEKPASNELEAIDQAEDLTVRSPAMPEDAGSPRMSEATPDSSEQPKALEAESRTCDLISTMLGTNPGVIDHIINSKSTNEATKLLGVR